MGKNGSRFAWRVSRLAYNDHDLFRLSVPPISWPRLKRRALALAVIRSDHAVAVLINAQLDDILACLVPDREHAALGTTDSGGGIAVYNKTGEEVVQLQADNYGNGVVGAYNRKGKGRTLKPGRDGGDA